MQNEKINNILLAFFLFLNTQLLSQDTISHRFKFNGYVEVYYQYDFNKPTDNNRSGFVYSHNRHNEFNLNLGFIKMKYEDQKIRANLALAAGTYMTANYAAEPGVLKNIHEANAGIKLSNHKELWLDAGVLGSHIGFESAASQQCWNLTRSILADNSPYFEGGARITYTADNGKWLFSIMALNGWQRISRVNGNSLLSWGTQIQYKPTEKVLINHSSFIGTDKPDSLRLNRIFYNLYGIFNITDKFSFTAGFDIGMEEKFPGSGENNTWYSPVLIFRQLVNEKWAFAARGEFYSDKKGVIIKTGTPHGFKTAGYSLNVDYIPAKNILVRIEARNFYSRDKIFKKGTSFVKNNTFITSSMAVSF